MSDFFLPKRFLVKPTLYDLVFQRVAVLPTEHQVVVLLVRTNIFPVQQVVRPQLRNRFAPGPRVLSHDLLDAVTVGGRVRGYLVQSAQLIGGSVEQVRVRLDLVLSLERFGELLIRLAC